MVSCSPDAMRSAMASRQRRSSAHLRMLETTGRSNQPLSPITLLSRRWSVNWSSVWPVSYGGYAVNGVVRDSSQRFESQSESPPITSGLSRGDT